MRYLSLLITALLIGSNILLAQSPAELIKNGDSLYKQFKEEESLGYYKSALNNSPNDLNLLKRITEICLSAGGRQKDINLKKKWYNDGFAYAQKAWQVDSNSTISCYIMAGAKGKLTEVETDKKKVVGYVRDIKNLADRGLRINPNDGKMNFLEGKWHYEMVTLNWAKRLAVKALYGGLPDGNLDSCISYLEKCRQQDIYNVRNFLMLAKAYKESNEPTKTTDILNKLLKLPTSCLDDKDYKEEAKKMLEELQ